jgi:hypothetical protein
LSLAIGGLEMQKESNLNWKIMIAIWSVVLCSPLGCVRKSVIVGAANTPPKDNSYEDLAPGWRLRILIPLLNSGGYSATMDSGREVGGTTLLSAANLAGYEVSYYSIEKRAGGKVHLRFESAEVTKNGETKQEKAEPKLPFALPTKNQHIRLIFLVRQSVADHNMAISASESVDALNAFMSRLKNDPDACKPEGEVFCSWVPEGIAARPEPLSSSR